MNELIKFVNNSCKIFCKLIIFIILTEPNEIEIISSSDEREKTDKETAAEKGKAKDKDRDGEREKSKTPKIVLKRKRGSKIAMACKVNGKGM